MKNLPDYNVAETSAKDPHKVMSYRPISLLPTMSKILEKIILRRIKTIVAGKKLIPNHQFRSRNKHATIEQVHKVSSKQHHNKSRK